MPSHLPRRRLLVLAGGGLSTVFSGCLNAASSGDERRSSPPEYDCTNASRPEPAPPDDNAEDALRPISYPTPLESLSDTDTVIAYVKAYEQAYRHNSQLETRGDELTHFSMSFESTRTYDSPATTALVRVQYQFFETITQADSRVIADSPTISVTYYVDQSVIIRAESMDVHEDTPALDPDPWTGGSPVECFE